MIMSLLIAIFIAVLTYEIYLLENRIGVLEGLRSLELENTRETKSDPYGINSLDKDTISIKGIQLKRENGTIVVKDEVSGNSFDCLELQTSLKSLKDDFLSLRDYSRQSFIDSSTRVDSLTRELSVSLDEQKREDIASKNNLREANECVEKSVRGLSEELISIKQHDLVATEETKSLFEKKSEELLRRILLLEERLQMEELSKKRELRVLLKVLQDGQVVVLSCNIPDVNISCQKNPGRSCYKLIFDDRYTSSDKIPIISITPLNASGTGAICVNILRLYPDSVTYVTMSSLKGIEKDSDCVLSLAYIN